MTFSKVHIMGIILYKTPPTLALTQPTLTSLSHTFPSHILTVHPENGTLTYRPVHIHCSV